MITDGAVLGFDWDEGNRQKNWLGHRVSAKECEEIFFDENKKIAEDSKHSVKEKRHLIIGKTRADRLLYAVFTVRKQKVRIISARDLNKKERHLYEKAT